VINKPLGDLCRRADLGVGAPENMSEVVQSPAEYTLLFANKLKQPVLIPGFIRVTAFGLAERRAGGRAILEN
jgi:hypothetical protein